MAVTPQASAPSLRQSLDAAMQSRPQRTYKYGSCEKHGALRPHVFKGGRRAGQAVLMCAQWWKFDTEGRRLCWYSRSVDAEGLKQWPRCLQNEFFSLKAHGLGSRRPAAVGNHFSMCCGVHVNNVALAGCL